ncbi:C2H2 transcription factor [Fusarium denticulatum]|uniref:C2H2 transcription factor n=1 Tax=Fusarium denticulatum TaxID=48507 RepID=A0A8H5TWP4_9HYPO|nr:C2H2 transcription factor [Fusarium denticulatum]
MGNLVDEGHQIKFNGKLLSELATKPSRRIHWLPQDRVKMEQWLRANRTTAFLEDTSDTCLNQLALAIGLEFRRLDQEQKTLVKAKMRSSLKYTLNKLKLSGEVSERWDPRGKQVVLDWTQSKGRSLRGIQDGINNSPCAAPPTHHLTPPVLPTRFLPPERSSRSATPYSVQANFVETDLQRATEEFYRQKAHLDKFEDLISPRHKTNHQGAIAQYVSAVRDTRRHSDREVELSMGRGQAARKETPTADRTLARGRDHINLEPCKTSLRSLTPEMAERKSPALHESDSTKAHRKFIQKLREGSYLSGTTTKNDEGMIPEVDEVVWTSADEHFQQRLVNTSVPDTPPVPKRSAAGNRALRQQSSSNNKVLQRSSRPDQPKSPTSLYKEPSLVYPHPDLVNGVKWTFGMRLCLGLLVALDVLLQEWMACSRIVTAFRAGAACSRACSGICRQSKQAHSDCSQAALSPLEKGSTSPGQNTLSADILLHGLSTTAVPTLQSDLPASPFLTAIGGFVGKITGGGNIRAETAGRPFQEEAIATDMRESVSAVKIALQRQSPQSQPLDQSEVQTASQEQNHSQIVPPVPAPTDGLIQRYRSKVEDAILRMNAMINTRMNAKSDTCKSEDYKTLHKYYTGVSVVRTMSASEYLELSRDARPQDSIVVCTMAEATSIINRGPPTIPVLIPGTPNPQRLKIDTFLA